MGDQDRILRIDLSSPVPGYRQIADGLRAMLVGGTFKAGEQIPTVRQVAIDLGVHHNTVAEAYRILAEEGWLELKRRRGAVVVERESPKPKPEAEASLAKRLRELAAEAVGRGLGVEVVRETLKRVASELPVTGGES
jgi:GntR family transcriptional regulator